MRNKPEDILLTEATTLHSGAPEKRESGAIYVNYNCIHSVARTCDYCSPVLLCSLQPISTSHLAARPPGLRLETLGFPSLSVPPEMVNPRVLPSFLISSTTVTPLNSSERSGIKTNISVEGTFLPNPTTAFSCRWWESRPGVICTVSMKKASVYLSCETEVCPGGPRAVEGKHLHAGLAGKTKQDKTEEGGLVRR